MRCERMPKLPCRTVRSIDPFANAVRRGVQEHCRSADTRAFARLAGDPEAELALIEGAMARIDLDEDVADLVDLSPGEIQQMEEGGQQRPRTRFPVDGKSGQFAQAAAVTTKTVDFVPVKRVGEQPVLRIHIEGQCADRLPGLACEEGETGMLVRRGRGLAPVAAAGVETVDEGVGARPPDRVGREMDGEAAMDEKRRFPFAGRRYADTGLATEARLMMAVRTNLKHSGSWRGCHLSVSMI